MISIQSTLNFGHIGNLKRSLKCTGLDKAAVARIEASLKDAVKAELTAAGLEFCE